VAVTSSPLELAPPLATTPTARATRAAEKAAINIFLIESIPFRLMAQWSAAACKRQARPGLELGKASGHLLN
jgi:hypothetical protein